MQVSLGKKSLEGRIRGSEKVAHRLCQHFQGEVLERNFQGELADAFQKGFSAPGTADHEQDQQMVRGAECGVGTRDSEFPGPVHLVHIHSCLIFKCNGVFWHPNLSHTLPLVNYK